MIKYAIVVPGVPDKDGEYSVGIRIIKQDEDQVAISGCGDLTFQASNGWRVQSSKIVQVIPKEKLIAIMGVYQTGTYTHSIACTHKANETTAYVATLEEAIKVKEEIVQAINEWVLNGGFDKILKAEGETPTEYNYEVTDYYEGR